MPPHQASGGGAPREPLPGRRAPLTGVVLAGGLSSRLGHDKAVLRLTDGESGDLLSRAVSLVRTVCGQAIVIGRERPGEPSFPDLTPGYGPVGGIATALEVSQTSCLVISCDMPFMEASVLARLAEARLHRPEGMLSTAYKQKDTGHVEALVAIYEVESLPYFQECIASRLLKISKVLPPHLQYFIPYDAEDALPFFNINYPADLLVARRMIRMLGQE